MKLIDPSIEIMSPINGEEILKHIELCGKVCWKSESNIKEDSAKVFVKTILDKAHESVIEHYNITVRFTCTRGCANQITRHRLASYSQESTRYCNYSKGKFNSEVTFIKPVSFDNWSTEEQFAYKQELERIEKSYLHLTDNLKMKPERARGILPLDLKTELVATMNLRSWRHFLKMRTDKHAQDEVRKLAKDLLIEFKNKIPVIFDDIV